MWMTLIPVVTGAFGMAPQRLERRLEQLELRRQNRGHPNYSIVEISQNTEKCPGDLKRLAVPQTPVKDNQFILKWKTHSNNK